MIASARRHILVTGTHRSGTTLVGRILATSAAVSYLQEPFNIQYPNRAINLRVTRQFYSAEGAPLEQYIASAYDDLLCKRRRPVNHALLMCKAGEKDSKFILRFCKYFLRSLFWGVRYLLKDPIALTSSGWLYERYCLSVVCMIRSPLSFSGSLKKWNWSFDFAHFRDQPWLMRRLPDNLSNAIMRQCRRRADIIDQSSLLWNILAFLISMYRKKYPHWCFVRYEDLARDPQAIFEVICAATSLPMSKHMTKVIRLYTGGGNLPETETPAFTRRDSVSSLRNWESRLSPDDVDRVVAATENIASEFYPEGIVNM